MFIIYNLILSLFFILNIVFKNFNIIIIIYVKYIIIVIKISNINELLFASFESRKESIFKYIKVSLTNTKNCHVPKNITLI